MPLQLKMKLSAARLRSDSAQASLRAAQRDLEVFNRQGKRGSNGGNGNGSSNSSDSEEGGSGSAGGRLTRAQRAANPALYRHSIKTNPLGDKLPKKWKAGRGAGGSDDDGAGSRYGGGVRSCAPLYWGAVMGEGRLRLSSVRLVGWHLVQPLAGWAKTLFPLPMCQNAVGAYRSGSLSLLLGAMLLKYVTRC